MLLMLGCVVVGEWSRGGKIPQQMKTADFFRPARRHTAGQLSSISLFVRGISLFNLDLGTKEAFQQLPRIFNHGKPRGKEETGTRGKKIKGSRKQW